MIEAMEQLGHVHFRLAGHDRGGRVAYRLTLDHPGRVERLATLDIVPTYEMWHRMDRNLAMKVWHWPFLAQPEPLPEMLISKAPVEYLEWKLASWTKAKNLSAFDPRALDHYRAAFADPLRIHAHCEDRVGDLVGLDQSADRLPRAECLGGRVRVVGLVEEATDPGGGRGAGEHGVDPDALAHVVGGHRHRQRGHGALAGGVQRALGYADGGDDRADVDDRGVLGGAQVGEGGGRDPGHADDVHVEEVRPLGVVVLGHVADRADAGVVDEYVDAAEGAPPPRQRSRRRRPGR